VIAFDPFRRLKPSGSRHTGPRSGVKGHRKQSGMEGWSPQPKLTFSCIPQSRNMVPATCTRSESRAFQTTRGSYERLCLALIKLIDPIAGASPVERRWAITTVVQAPADHIELQSPSLPYGYSSALGPSSSRKTRTPIKRTSQSAKPLTLGHPDKLQSIFRQWGYGVRREVR